MFAQTCLSKVFQKLQSNCKGYSLYFEWYPSKIPSILVFDCSNLLELTNKLYAEKQELFSIPYVLEDEHVHLSWYS